MLIDDQRKKEELAAIVKKVDESQISSIRNITSGIVKIINNPDSTAKNLKELVEIDPPLTAKVLKIANSAYYFSRVHIGDIEQAIIWIGFDALKGISLAQKVVEIFADGSHIPGFSRLALWKHSVAVAVLAKLIYRMEYGERGENIYAAGLLHDIGIIARDQLLHESFREIFAAADRHCGDLNAAEMELCGYHHGEIGAAIGEQWQFPREIIQGIAHHHEPLNSPEDTRRAAATLFVANTLCHNHGFTYIDGYTPNRRLFEECLVIMEVDNISINLIFDEMKNEMAILEVQGWF